jgi:hypothetical protein
VASEPATPGPTAPPPEPAAVATLTIDVDAVRDADDATTQVLHLRVEVDGRPALEERLEFTGEGYVERSRRRATLQLEGVIAGRQHVVVKASADPGFASRVATGSIQAELRPGANRLSARVRYLSDTDREVRLR